MIKSASRASYVRFGVVLLVVIAGFGIRIASNAHSLFGHDKKGGESDSAFHQQNFAKALDALRGKVGADGRVLEIRVEPGKVKFTVQTGADSAHGYEWDGDSLDDRSVQLVGQGTLEGLAIPLAKIDPAITERLATAAAQRYGGTLDDVDHLTLDRDVATGKAEWSINVYRDGAGALYLSDLDGGDLHSPGEPTVK